MFRFTYFRGNYSRKKIDLNGKKISTEIHINASPEKVWQVLTNFENYPNWNPFIKTISGEKVVGQELATEITPPNRKSMKFKPKVLVFNINKELWWLGTAPIKRLFDSEHYFRLVEQEKGTVKFEHGEMFSGILVGMMPKLLIDTKLGFEQMNEALKIACEN